MSARLDVDVRARRGAFQLAARFGAPLDGVTALFGPSGAGKSMLLSALAGLARLDSGRIVMGDRVLDDVAAGTRVPPHQRGVGLVFQDARLFPHLTVRQNLAFAVQRAPQLSDVVEAAGQFELVALLDRPVRNLSGGERSRVALARALLSAPDLLLLDEPFAALDGVRRRTYIATLREIHARQCLPMIVVTHLIDDAAALADRVIGLKAGAVVAEGLMREVVSDAAFHGLLDARDVGAAIARDVLNPSAADAGAAWVRADHVMLAVEQPRGLSARHVWEGRIGAMTIEAGGSSLVRVETATGSVLSRVTAQAAADLSLAPGRTVWAIVKAHAI